jgi:hypothetical protein
MQTTTLVSGAGSRRPAAAAQGLTKAALCPCADFLRGIFPKIEWEAFLEGARGVRATHRFADSHYSSCLPHSC